MGLEVEAMGDLVTAGLIAREVEGDKGDQSAHAHAAHCANCGTAVTANYCAQCGQKTHLHRSVLHLAEELIHGLFHFETKGWRTLPMLVAQPGQLTRRYIDGQRTRFVSPLALFLFMMFLMFFVFSLTMGKSSGDSDHGPTAKASQATRMASKMAKQAIVIADLERAAAAASTPEAVASSQAKLAKARKKRAAIEERLKAIDAKADGKPVDDAAQPASAAKASSGSAGDGDDDYVNVDEIVKDSLGASSKANFSSDIAWLDKGVKHAVDNPELALYKLKNAAYKYSFLLVPISLPFLWLIFFWKRGITMYDHAVFSLYSLSFMSLLFVLLAGLAYFDFGGTAVALFCVVPPVHMFMQLRGTYQLSRGQALWRTSYLLFVTMMVLSLYTVVVLALTAA
jgi:hypothetical protein